jgi:23S rRNA pseudouridine2605 synthase
MRLQKYLAYAGLCSRRKAEEYMVKGRVKVNGKVVRVLGTQVDPGSDIVLFDESRIILKQDTKKIYIALNKPEGYVSSCARQNSKIVMDLIKLDKRIYPVGRLDKDSKGLILLTNDGELHHKLSHPSFDHEKEYRVTTSSPISDKALRLMAGGMVIDNKKTRKAGVERISDKQFKIVLKEGRNRQIRKMIEQTGNKVKTLQRIRIANIRLGKLKEGNWRYLSLKEINGLT